MTMLMGSAATRSTHGTIAKMGPSDRGNKRAFWDIVNDMAAGAGIERPTVVSYTNGAGATGGFVEAPASSSAGKPKQADILYTLSSAEVSLFTAPDGEAYAQVPIDTHLECHKLRTKGFRSYLSSVFYADQNTLPGAQAVEDAIRLLEWDARKDQRELFTRIGHHNGKVYIDLGNATWDAVEIDASGYRVAKVPPIAFRRSKSTAALPYPAPCTDLGKLRPFINCEADDWPLVAAWAVASVYPFGPYPVLVMAGEQGSAKSTNMRALKKLIDPASADLRGQPEDIRDLMIAANNNLVLAYDNISRLAGDVSDALCRVSTGGGYATRALYSDDEELLIDVMRPIAMNGIAELVNRADLMGPLHFAGIADPVGSAAS